MKHRIFAALTAGLLLCGILTGCGGKQETSTTQQTAAPAAQNGEAQADGEAQTGELPENTFIITLYPDKAPITCDRVVDTSWSHSRNIKKVEGEDTIISGHAMTDKPRVPKGWYLDKESYYEGTNADGYPFRTYTIRRIKKRRIDHKLKPAQIRKLTKRKRKTKK